VRSLARWCVNHRLAVVRAWVVVVIATIGVQAMLDRVARLPSVAGVTSPFSPAGARQISANHTIAFAAVDFTQGANLNLA
jgi:hypothetical protein